MRCGVGIVRVHLHRQTVVGIQDLGQQRKDLGLLMTEVVLVFLPGDIQGLALQRPVGDDIRTVRVRRNGPQLADPTVRDLVTELGFELTAAPDLFVKYGFQKKLVPSMKFPPHYFSIDPFIESSLTQPPGS